jgi:hypothetical protein
MIPAEVVTALAGLPVPGVSEQALPLLTVDADGFPRVCLLSRAEVDADADEVRVAIASTRTRANLERDGRACLVVVVGTTAHYVKLRVTRALDVEGRFGAALALVAHQADSLGIPLEPITYTPTAALGELERWDLSARTLAAVAG